MHGRERGRLFHHFGRAGRCGGRAVSCGTHPCAPCHPAPPRPSNTIHKQAEEHFLKYEAQRAKKIASKSHRERIKELNEVRG